MSSTHTTIIPLHGAGGGDSLRVSLLGVLKTLPGELRGKNPPTTAGRFAFSFPRHQVAEQLHQGTVKVPFGQIRRAAPVGVFLSTPNHDAQLIDLPLDEILKQLPVDSFSRRPDQTRIEPPADIEDLFGAKGQRLASVRVLKKNEIQPSPAQPVPCPAAPAAEVRPQTPLPAVTTPAAPKPASPAGPIKAPVLDGMRSTVAPALAASRSAASPQLRSPRLDPASAPAQAAHSEAGARGATERAGGAAVTQAQRAGTETLKGGQPTGTIVVELAELAERWPEAIRQEITRLNLVQSKCHLPMSEIGPALKRGTVQYSWLTIRSRLKPGPFVPSPHGATVLELPLPVIASALFSQGQQASGPPPAAQPRLEALTAPRPAPETTPPAPRPSPIPQARSVPAAPARLPDEEATAAPVRPTPPAPAHPQDEQAEPAPVSPPEPVAVPAPPVSAPAAPSAGGGRVLQVPLEAVSQGWPPALRQVLRALNLAQATLEIPFEAIEASLKLGKVTYTCKRLAEWFNPRPRAGLPAILAETLVELPLPVLTPLYLKHRPAPARKAAGGDMDIPDLFNASGKIEQPEAGADASKEAAAPVARAVPSAPSQTEPAPAAPVPQAKNLAELFGEPDKRNWTPNEIVHKAGGLPGVAGALITLQDGLLVASCMPPEWKNETIAAFIPQIYGRMIQYAKELNMGEVQSVTFSVEQGCFQIFSAGIIYFAVLGRPGAVLPQPALNLIATELSRHTK